METGSATELITYSAERIVWRPVVQPKKYRYRRKSPRRYKDSVFTKTVIQCLYKDSDQDTLQDQCLYKVKAVFETCKQDC